MQTHTFLASHTNTKSLTTIKTAGRMQAEKHRYALPTGPIQASIRVRADGGLRLTGSWAMAAARALHRLGDVTWTAKLRSVCR